MKTPRTCSVISRTNQIILSAALASVAACSSSTPPQDSAGTGGAAPLVDRYAVAGRTSNVGFTGWTKNAGSGGAAGSAGMAAIAAMGGAGTAGHSANAAGSGGASIAPAAGAGAAGSTEEEDPFADLFGDAMAGGAAPQLSCEGMVCLEFADCANLHPDENAACKFTRCEDLQCK